MLQINLIFILMQCELIKNRILFVFNKYFLQIKNLIFNFNRIYLTYMDYIVRKINFLIN